MPDNCIGPWRPSWSNGGILNEMFEQPKTINDAADTFEILTFKY